ncbi:hypothetical protein O181_041162 [Austropuccinia psidii MF-1]|uniref:DASH complex subunit DAD1 n=1 Tax=Austropuccinia psidii MF-1 TaxID=1389203 RepID=A0A9Q3HEK8_9BASI|nr:hypothetical protein [Austropuccinia psidii MF-1]
MEYDAEDNLGHLKSEMELEDEHRNFDNQRLKWIAEISESIGRLYTNLNSLNRNIESVNVVGKQFENVYDLWSKFEQVIGAQPAAGHPSSNEHSQHAFAAQSQPTLHSSTSSAAALEASIEFPHAQPSPGGETTKRG